MEWLRRWMRTQPRTVAFGVGCVLALLLLLAAALVAELVLRYQDLQAVAPIYETEVRPLPPASRPVSASAATDSAPTTPTPARPIPKHESKPVPRAPTLRRISATKMFQPDPFLGYALAPSVEVRVRKRHGADLTYTATYTIDSRGRRRTPRPPVEKAPTRCLLFFGCSYTFGDGVDDWQTLPAQVGFVARSYRVYNYGLPGAGPQHMVEQLKHRTDSKAVPERRGIAIYTFLHEHINRAVGTPRVTGTYGKSHPWYALDKRSGRLIRRGTFTDRGPLRRLRSGSRLVDAVVDYHGERTSRTDAELAAALIIEGKRLFTETFTSDGFYVLLFPARQGGHTDFVKRTLAAAGVKVLDYRNALGADVDLDKHFFPGDGHPRAVTYTKIAALLCRDLGLAPAAVSETDRAQ